MRPVSYEAYTSARRLGWRAVIHLGLAWAATALINFLIPEVDTSAGDTPTAVKLLEGLTAFLLWVIVVLSTLILLGVFLLEIYARIAGVELPHTGRGPDQQN